LPTTGSSSPFFALASLAQRGAGGRIVAVEQTCVVAAELGTGASVAVRDEPVARALAERHMTGGAEIAISLAAYERAFDAKLRLEAAPCRRCGTRSYPRRLRGTDCGSEDGVAQCVELFQRLRGEAANQVDGARWALAHNVAGPIAVAAVTILGTARP
jgi:hypothetical protein